IGHALTSSVEYGFIDSVDASIYASKSKAMTAVGEAWTQSDSGSKAMEAQIQASQRDVSVLQRQSISNDDRLTCHIQHEHDRFRELICTRDAGPKDGPADAGSSC
nr:hypothetical protein [Tanacetum cinerariifolium]